jgi:hypothetical protein
MDNMDTTAIDTFLKIWVGGVFIVTVVLMVILTIKIYKGEARNADAGPKNKGW